MNNEPEPALLYSKRVEITDGEIPLSNVDLCKNSKALFVYEPPIMEYQKQIYLFTFLVIAIVGMATHIWGLYGILISGIISIIFMTAIPGIYKDIVGGVVGTGIKSYIIEFGEDIPESIHAEEKQGYVWIINYPEGLIKVNLGIFNALQGKYWYRKYIRLTSVLAANLDKATHKQILEIMSKVCIYCGDELETPHIMAVCRACNKAKGVELDGSIDKGIEGKSQRST